MCNSLKLVSSHGLGGDDILRVSSKTKESNKIDKGEIVVESQFEAFSSIDFPESGRKIRKYKLSKTISGILEIFSNSINSL